MKSTERHIPYILTFKSLVLQVDMSCMTKIVLQLTKCLIPKSKKRKK